MNDFLRQKRVSSGGKPHVGATVHRNFDRLRFLWPDAQYIHLIRDPRDVARSVLQKGWAGNIYQASEFWIQAENCWDSLVTQLSSDQAIQIHYEDLVRRNEVVLTEICRFVGVDYSQKMLDYPAMRRSIRRPIPAWSRSGRRSYRSGTSRWWKFGQVPSWRGEATRRAVFDSPRSGR